MRLWETRKASSIAAVFLAGVFASAGTETPKKPPAPPAGTPPKSAAPGLAAGAPLRILPKARKMSTYVTTIRFEATVKDVDYEAPDAYKEGFGFWASRMKGQRRSEVYEMKTITEEPDEEGLLPFRRSLPKFDVEIQRQGQIMASPESLEHSVGTILYKGRLDPLGNVKEINKVAGPDTPEIEELAIPEIFRLYPVMDGPHDLKIGESFKEEQVVHLPTKLNIAGLEHVTMRVTREYILKSADNGVAKFDVKTTYADDPAFKPELENTSCKISGGGTGEATFEIARGVFGRTRIPTTLRIDIEAPLRPLPNQPKTDKTLLGKSHIILDLLLAGDQSVRRLWGEDQD